MSDSQSSRKPESRHPVANSSVVFRTKILHSVRIDTVPGSSWYIGSGLTGLAYRHSPVRASFLSNEMTGNDGTMAEKCRETARCKAELKALRQYDGPPIPAYLLALAESDWQQELGLIAAEPELTFDLTEGMNAF